MALTSHGVAVRPKITTHLRVQASASPGGVSSPKYTCFLGIQLDVCLNRNEKKNKPRLPRIARHSNRTQCTAFPSVALVITAALTGDSRRECVCLRQRCPAEEYFELFIYSAACCSFSLSYGELGQSRVKISASIEDGDFSPGASL